MAAAEENVAASQGGASTLPCAHEDVFPQRDTAGLLRRHGFIEQREIGQGAYGKAVLVEAPDGARLVSKMVDVSKAVAREMEEAEKERRILASLQHPYIVGYHESFTDGGWFCILMDYCEGGDLTRPIAEARQQRQSLPESQVQRWFTQALLALYYIHSLHILHRDLKPANFFLARGGGIQLGDFGIAKSLSCTIAVAKTRIGTPYYLSPELCKGKPYNWPSDIWAMGCIVYELCALKVAFDAPSVNGLIKEITKGDIPGLPQPYSPFLRQVCGEMLTRDPASRPSANLLLQQRQLQIVAMEMLCETASVEDSSGPGRGGCPSELGTTTASQPSYRKGDVVDFYSATIPLPATVVEVGNDGSIIIDLKPNEWISTGQQATGIRPQRPLFEGEPELPSAQRQLAQPPSSRPTEAVAVARAVSSLARPRSTSTLGGSSPPFYHALPSRRHSSPGSAPETPPRTSIVYKVGDAVEYYSITHKAWVLARVITEDCSGRIILDLKPNTWISKEEQLTRIRPQGAGIAGSYSSSSGLAVRNLATSPPIGRTCGRSRSTASLEAAAGACRGGPHSRSHSLEVPSRDALHRQAKACSPSPSPGPSRAVTPGRETPPLPITPALSNMRTPCGREPPSCVVGRGATPRKRPPALPRAGAVIVGASV